MKTEEINQRCFAAIANVHQYAAANLPKDRASAIVLTKLDEAMLWLMHGTVGSAVDIAMAKQRQEIAQKTSAEATTNGTD